MEQRVISMWSQGEPDQTATSCPDDGGGTCNDVMQLSACDCGHILRYRATCGEWDEATEALDRLGAEIIPDEETTPDRQWRLMAAEMAMLLTDEQLAQVKAGHDDRMQYLRAQRDLEA